MHQPMLLDGLRGRLALAALLLAVAAGRAPAAVTLPGAGGATVAVAGWTSGDESKQKLRRGAAGAGVATLSAGAAGYYMDVLESKLRERLDRSGVGVARRGEEITLSMPAALVFVGDGADLNPAFGTVLDGVANVLGHYEKTVLEVAGHGDERDGEAGPADARAATVAAYLERRGIAASRLLRFGAGASRPLAHGGGESGRARNRRIEVTVVPLVRDAG
ncbi:MAG: OmpA family protein [Proteobacteria bacterium]|nr:OmpA family protein [Pseudomonadota bacterium]